MRTLTFLAGLSFSCLSFASSIHPFHGGTLDSCGANQKPYIFQGPASNVCHHWNVTRSDGWVAMESYDRGYLDACGKDGVVYLNPNGPGGCQWFKYYNAGNGYVYLVQNGRYLDSCGKTPYMYKGPKNDCHKWKIKD